MSDTRTVTLQVSGMIRATSKNVTEAHLSRQPALRTFGGGEARRVGFGG